MSLESLRRKAEEMGKVLVHGYVLLTKEEHEEIAVRCFDKLDEVDWSLINWTIQPPAPARSPAQR
jgi:hypothetical protein